MAVALVVLPGGSSTEPPPAAPLARFAPIAAPGGTVVLRADGEVRAIERVRLAAEVDGRIVRVAEGLETGARLAAGDLVVALDPALYETAVADARARLAETEARIRERAAQTARIRTLTEDELDSEARLDDARLAERAARAARDRAAAALREAELRLEDTRIEAPFDAIVVEEDAAAGRLLAAGAVVAELASAEGAEIEIGLPPAAESTLRVGLDGAAAAGLEARVRPVRAGAGGNDDDASRAGVIDRVQPEIDPRTRTLDLVVRVADAFRSVDGRPALRLGELVAVELEVPARADWWQVPATALKGPGRLWRLGPEDRLEAVDVDVLLRSADGAIVRSAELAAGDRVLLTDLVRAAPGLEVRVARDAGDVETEGNETDAGGRSSGGDGAREGAGS